ncbi:MAG: hypothetical protein B7Z59_06015 [Acidiphilium sp. 37-67-22]|nr:MAG: hypothetical protein B7Z59_06015 [Acidiphilium sp. 37-67-22]
MTASPPSPFWADSAAGLLVALKVQPGARRPRLGPVVEAPPSPGWPPARLRVAVAAPPQEGRANEAVLKALAEGLGLSPSRQAGAGHRPQRRRSRAAPHSTRSAKRSVKLGHRPIPPDRRFQARVPKRAGEGIAVSASASVRSIATR